MNIFDSMATGNYGPTSAEFCGSEEKDIQENFPELKGKQSNPENFPECKGKELSDTSNEVKKKDIVENSPHLKGKLLSSETRYMLSKQIPSIDEYEMVIETNYGQAIIDDPELITRLKKVIEQHY